MPGRLDTPDMQMATSAQLRDRLKEILETLDSGGADVFIAKSADQVVSDTDVLQNDEELFFAVQANESWLFKLWSYREAVDQGWKCTFTAPSGATGGWISGVGNLTTGSGVLSFGDAFGAAGSHTRLGVGWGVVEAGEVPGSLQLQFAQFSEGAGSAVSKQNSVLMAWRLG